MTSQIVRAEFSELLPCNNVASSAANVEAAEMGAELLEGSNSAVCSSDVKWGQNVEAKATM